MVPTWWLKNDCLVQSPDLHQVNRDHKMEWHINNIDEDAVNQQIKVIAPLFQHDTEESTWFWPTRASSNCRDGKGKGVKPMILLVFSLFRKHSKVDKHYREY